MKTNWTTASRVGLLATFEEDPEVKAHKNPINLRLLVAVLGIATVSSLVVALVVKPEIPWPHVSESSGPRLRPGRVVEDQQRTSRRSSGVQCRVTLVESIPEGLTFNGTPPVALPSTYWAFRELLNSAEATMELASSYWTLRGQDVYSDPSDWQGEDVFRGLVEGEAPIFCS